MIGRELDPDEVVHHKDGNPNNDSWDNLEVLPSQSQHAAAHAEPRLPTAPCSYCGEPVKLTARRRKNKHVFCTHSCYRSWRR